MTLVGLHGILFYTTDLLHNIVACYLKRRINLIKACAHCYVTANETHVAAKNGIQQKRTRDKLVSEEPIHVTQVTENVTERDTDPQHVTI
jgi:hypothetical protein